MTAISRSRCRSIRIGNAVYTRPFGSTGRAVSEIGFGCFAIGGNRSGNSYGPTDDAVSIAALREAIEQGCTFFDTADVYGFGHSEALLGSALRDAGRPEVTVATKGGGDFTGGSVRANFSPDYLRRAVEASLRRLAVERLDLYQLHNPGLADIANEAMWAMLRTLQDEGKIAHFGASLHDVAEARACLRVDGLASVQLPYNMLWVLEPEAAAEMNFLFDDVAEAGVALIVREPLLGGVLGQHPLLGEFGPGDIRAHWPRDRRERLSGIVAAMQALLHPGTSLAQAALRYVLDHPQVATAIVGIKTAAQARENFAASDLPPFTELVRTAEPDMAEL
jgi:aryl-alcohol dehydrogenase-like predicted oxidoreductase